MKMLSPHQSVIGVIGAGTMGQGIAQVCAMHGFQVILYDINETLTKNGFDAITRVLQTLSAKGKIEHADVEAALKRIRVSCLLEEVTADLIIEAVVEKMDVKQKIFSVLEQVNPQDTILSSNTSSLSITGIGKPLRDPSRFAGLHFFNPAPVMKLVEIVSGVATSDETVQALRDFCTSIGKAGVLANDSPGFIVNRVARPFYVEALKVVEEHVSDFAGVDKLMRSAGFRMGPIELMDLIGIDTNFSVTSSLFDSFHQEPRFRPSRVQQQKVEAGQLGRKTGKGFYDYPSK